MRRDAKNKLRTRILIEKNSNNLILEYLNQNKFSPKIEFKAEQSAGIVLMNFMHEHGLSASFVEWKKKNHIDTED